MTEQAVPASARKGILFLFSDTGGGHRSATEAIIEALELEFPGTFATSKIDFLRGFPPPINRAPELYPPLSKYGAWGASFHTFNTRRGANALADVAYPYVRKAAKKLVEDHPADLIVSVHPLANSIVTRAMRKHPRPFMTVVTDMVTTHAFWFDRHADLVVVPTEVAKQRGVEFGIPAGNLRVIGLPVDERFRAVPSDRMAFRRRVGWREDLPVILLVGGGDGMGPVKRIAKAINEDAPQAQLVVICGRNESLRAELEGLDWNLPAHLYGFTTQMPDFMWASDIMVTKAGPGSISEAFICGLPIVLYSRLAGQEEGNVDYVVDGGAGVWTPRPREAVEVIRHWVDDPAARERVAAASRALARPDASRQIARLIAEQLGVF
ncbi:MAG: glycosyltransferase [Propionicimonas sp.]|uniref:MGDG synthase family glycosyltransferase n=1 Tax=Propionicimonas sp. TaxID=1955623 RepID=UPI002B1F43DF|nr:glycosyltransferase [Propionicimonas sp.]MEA4945762.1 glycosyltransferase [Propionicimonas sp.]MEA5055216.1 glycosyltransferase [Propionicimonas sp.]MEA5118562.1 glycosyltransferase [Propionicimonas sp.]